MEAAQLALATKLEHEDIAVCATLDAWRQPFFLLYYLGAKSSPCDSKAKFVLVRNDGLETTRGVIFLKAPLAILVQDFAESPAGLLKTN
jgi:hypothetical protein